MDIERGKLGRTDISLTTLGVGGYLGLLEDPRAGDGDCEAAAVAAVRLAVDLGVGYFDTSPGYGKAERHLGLGLRELSAVERAELTVSTKVGTHPERRQQYDADSVRWSLDRSLELLYCDGVDIIFVHDPTSDDHMDQILASGGAVDALEELKRQEVIRAIGLGVRNHRFLRRAIDSRRFDAILPSYDYHPLRTTALPVMELAASRGLGVVNGSPYNAGLLAGIDLDVAAKRRPPRDADLARARRLWEFCRERSIDLGVLAVQFSRRCAAVHTTLVGPRTASEVEDNIRHATTGLPPDTWEDLDTFVADLQPPAAPGGELEPSLA
jgi:aryl-alcohol dehydrogenase-like predicted oxidoreductase